MKQLFVPESTSTKVALNQIDPKNKFYGILNRGKRNFLRCSEDGKRGEEMYLEGFTHGKGHAVLHDRAVDLLGKMVEDSRWGSGVYEFDTLVELALWLEGKENYEVKPKRSHKKKSKLDWTLDDVIIEESSVSTKVKWYAFRRGNAKTTSVYLTNDSETFMPLSSTGSNARFYFDSKEQIDAILKKLLK